MHSNLCLFALPLLAFTSGKNIFHFMKIMPITVHVLKKLYGVLF